MANTPAPTQHTGVDHARDTGRQALERIGAIKANESVSPWQESAIAALGSLQKLESPRAQFDFVLAQAVTKAIDDHTDKMARLARTLNWLTGTLVVATLLLVGATLLMVSAGR